MKSFFSKKQFVVHAFLYAVVLGALAQFVPIYVFVPVALIVSAGHLGVVSRTKRRRYRSIIESARTAHIESLPTPGRIQKHNIDDLLLDSLKDFTAELEEKCFQLVEKNIQLLSLKEISLTIISSLNEPRIVDSIHSFLAKGLGFKEIFVGIFDQEKRELHLYTFREVLGNAEQEERTVRIEDIHGIIRKSIITRKPVLIKDADMHPIGKMDGDAIFADSTMKSYLIVPMVKSTFSQQCWKAPDCLLKQEPDPTRPGGLTMTPSPTSDSVDEGVCRSCGRMPVLGLIGVTDGFKAALLSQVDLVGVETLALQISTLLENAQLYSELKHEESFREYIINSIMNGLITADVHGSILLVNEAAERLTGYTADELKSMPIDDVIVDQQPGGGGGPVTRTLRRGEKVLQREVLLVKKDGAFLPIMLNTSLLVDEDKRIQGTIAVFLDITRIKGMEKKILQLDKLAALGRFSSSMAHEIRNPLSGILAGIEYIKRVGAIPEDQNENIAFILSEVNRIDRLITDILSVIQVKELAAHPTNLKNLISSSITTVEDIAKQKQVGIIFEIPDDSRAVMVDSDRITQVVINLLKNAVEASSVGGRVTVTVQFPMDVNDVLFDEIRDFVIIEIADDGVGFTEEEKTRLFEPFFTTKTEGTGLGLYVSHSIVERHGGYVFVESEKGKGSVFSVYLPIEKVQYGDSSEIGYPAGR
jgi:PAS domain S-box-containing protein